MPGSGNLLIKKLIPFDKLNQASANIKFIWLFLLALIMLPASAAIAQTDSNMDIFNRLVDSSVVKINKVIPGNGDTIAVRFSPAENYSVFRNRVVLDFSRLGRKIVPGSSNVVNYSIVKAGVNYGDMYRDGVFGDYFMPRTLSLKGSYSVESASEMPGEFHFTSVDTVAVDDLETIENPAYTFTGGDVPSEPFFSSLFAPVVAIGSAALAVILFFTVRSK